MRTLAFLLLGNLDVVAATVITGTLLACLAARYLRLVQWPLADLVYFAICVSLAVTYGFALYPATFAALIFAPQLLFFVVMAAWVAVGKWRDTSFRAPSLWWLTVPHGTFESTTRARNLKSKLVRQSRAGQLR